MVRKLRINEGNYKTYLVNVGLRGTPDSMYGEKVVAPNDRKAKEEAKIESMRHSHTMGITQIAEDEYEVRRDYDTWYQFLRTYTVNANSKKEAEDKSCDAMYDDLVAKIVSVKD
jgi:hypothetical protein